MERKAISVLAVDGGGIRGVIPARLLQHIEEEVGRPACELFDVIAGTSTGGIIALGLTAPRPGTTGTPAFSARELVDLYVDHGRTIFSCSLLWRLRSAFGLLSDRYQVNALESLLKQKFGDSKLSHALAEVVIPSYDMSGPGPFFFKRSYAANASHSWDVDTWRVARATSAAPTYFDPVELPPFEQEGPHALVDGGVFANNPAACAYADALALYGADLEINVLSLGTGALPPTPGRTGGPVPYRKALHWGLAQWARPIIGVVFDGVAKTVDYQLVSLCREGANGEPHYHRLQSSLPTASAAMDRAGAENLKRLVADAETLLTAEAEKLTGICEMLKTVAADRDAATAAS